MFKNAEVTDKSMKINYWNPIDVNQSMVVESELACEDSRLSALRPACCVRRGETLPSEHNKRVGARRG